MLDVSWLQRRARDVLASRAGPYLIGIVAGTAAATIAALIVGLPTRGAAEIAVRGVAFTLPANTNRLLASISIANEGSLPALIIGSNNAFILTSKKMTDREEDGEWEHLGDAEGSGQDAPRRLEPGAQWPDYAVVKTLERKEYEGFLSGASLIYFLMRTVYRDASLPATKHRITETCYVYVKDPQQPRACRGHNRRYVAD